MNIYLLPYTWPRHLVMALWCAAAGLFAWWTVLSLLVLGVDWPPGFDGPLLMCAISGSVAAASVWAECNLRRLPLLQRFSRVGLCLGLTVLYTLLWYHLWHWVVPALLFSSEIRQTDADDASLVSFTYRVGAFAMGGLACGLGPLVPRKGVGFWSHITGGIAAALMGGLAWHILNSKNLFSDLYAAGAAMGLVWGFCYGLFTWAIPDELYAGWVRVTSANRYARRIPIDALDGSAKERFIGHFPRGLDLFLPAEDGVQEMHISVAVTKGQVYKVRGLSLAPTIVQRFLERIDLRYDPRRSAPLETELSSGDRVVIGDGKQKAEIEFLMLPREES
jgi:hypothetical protein